MNMINYLKSVRIRIISMMLVLLCLFSNKALASHIAAADLYIDYIGTHPNDLRYKVTLVLFKACDIGSIDLPTSDYVNISSSCGGPVGNCNHLMPTVVGPDTLDQLCDTFKSINSCRVAGSIYPGFIRRIYIDTVTLPFACTDWKFSWNSCCRNTSILNLTTPSGDGMYIECMLNNSVKWNNSSPRFMIDPIPYLCIDQPAFFLNGPYDPNNDSLVASNSQPEQVGTTSGCVTTGVPINYAATFSLAAPIASTTPYAVNPNTGTATFTPNTLGKYVLGFRCDEYDVASGNLIGYIMRDVQVSVLNCISPAPQIDTLPQNPVNCYIATAPGGDKYIVAAPDCQMSFTTSAHTNSVTNLLFMSANNGQIIPTSTFTVAGQGGQNPTGTFTWTPTVADIGDYTIIITVKDSTCNNTQPIVLPNFLIVFIKVVPKINAGPDGKICKIDGQPWQFNVTGPNNVPYQWTDINGNTNPYGISDPNIKNPTAYPSYNMTYVVKTPVIPVGCHASDTVNVIIDTSNSVIASPKNLVVCRPGFIQIDAQGLGNPPLLNMACGTTNPLNCASPDTADVLSQAMNTVLINTNLQTPFPTFRTARIQMLVKKTDLYDYGMKPGTIKSIGFNITTPTSNQYDNFKILMTCTERTTLNAATGSFEPGTVQVYAAPTPVSLATPGWVWFTFDTPYNWDSTKNLIIEFCYANLATGTAAALSSLTTPTEAMAVAYSNVQGSTNICLNPSISSGTIYYAVRPEIKFEFCKAAFDVFHFNWKPGRYLSDSTSGTPSLFVDRSGRFIVTSIGGNGCKIQDSLDLKLPIHNYSTWPKDTAFCYGDIFKAIASGSFSKVDWFEDVTLSPTNPVFQTPTTLDCNTCASVIGKPLVSTNYYAVMADADGCADTTVVHAIIKPLPNVHILNNDTTIKYGHSIQLLVSGAYLYSWEPMSSLTNPNIVNPYASPTEPTTYHVFGIGENGCRNTDSMHVNIDYRDNLFVPSAFTPNGDGKNDNFKITNITFQRLMEFRVFNRWGQELFSTNDPKKGWDGTWKGVPQDMGVYQYLIRVAYPDGYVETYQGNVTLVR
jgi:gliding motility-associated-like protein